MLNSQNTENIKKILVERLNGLFAYYDSEPDKDSKNIKIDTELKEVKDSKKKGG